MEGYFNPESSNTGGGRERQIFIISKYLANNGYQVSILTDLEYTASNTGIDGINLYGGAISKLDSQPNIRVTSDVINYLRKLSQIDSDIYYTRGSPKHTIPTSVFCNIYGKKHVHALAGPHYIDPDLPYRQSLKGKVIYWCFIQAIKHTSEIVCLKERQKNLLDRHYNLNSRVIPLGYPDVSKNDLLDYNSREYYLWVGRLVKNPKQPLKFIKIASCLPDQRFLMVAKRMPNNESLSDEVRRHSNRLNNLSIEFDVNPFKMDRYYRNAKGLINTSTFEGFGNSYLEAWRYGVPAFTTDYNFPLLTANNIGYNAKSIQDLTRFISRTEKCPPKLKRMSENARQYFCTHHHINKIGKEHEDLFNSI